MNFQLPIRSVSVGRTTLWSLALLLTVSSSAAIADLQQDIRIAWEERQRLFITGHMNIEYFDIYNAGRAPGQVNNGEPGLKTDYVVVFDADRMSINRVGAVWLALEGKSVVQNHQSTYDCEHSYTMFQHPLLPHHVGNVATGDFLMEGWDYHSAAIVMNFHPLKPALKGVDPLAWSDVQKTTLHDRPVVTLRDGLRFKYTLDPQRQYILLRHEMFLSSTGPDVPIVTLDIQYEDHPQYGALPSSWTIVGINPQSRQIDDQWMARVTAVDFGTPVKDEDFVIDFPPGTVVSHGPLGVNGTVQEDGTLLVKNRDNGSTKRVSQTPGPSAFSISFGVLVGLATVLAFRSFVARTRST